MFFILFLTFLISLLIWDYFHKKRRNYVLESSQITGPKSWPIIGSALAFREVNTENTFYFLGKCKRTYGKIFRFWLLHKLNVVITDPKHLEIVLSSQQFINKSHLYNFLESWLGQGLLLSNGKKWHARRKIITPTFHFKILEQFVEVFDQQSSILVQKLQKRANGETVIDIFPDICLTALNIIAETAMGVKVNAQEQPDIEYVRALSSLARIMGNRFIRPFQRTDWLFFLTSPKLYWELTKSIKTLHEFTDKVIKERSESLQKSIADGTFKKDEINQVDDVGKKKRMAFLDVLLQSTINRQPLSNEDIREEVDTFMFEGHDTTTSGISFCLYLISRHPDVQDKIVEEINDVIGTDKSTPASYQNLQDLKYLDCVIKESLRLYPPVPAIGRMATEDIVLDNVTIPANTDVTLKLFLAMRDPEYFPEPAVFKPERFGANAKRLNPFAYVPFSAGPRNCIGQKFAVLEMKSTISKILRHFELLPLGEEVRPVIDLVLRSASGVNMGLKLRA